MKDKKETYDLVDAFLTTSIREFRAMMDQRPEYKAFTEMRVDYQAIADEIERIRDDWRLRRRDGEIH